MKVLVLVLVLQALKSVLEPIPAANSQLGSTCVSEAAEL